MSQPSLEPDADLPRSALTAGAPDRPALQTYETRFDLSFRHGPWTFHEFARRPLQELSVLLGKRGAEKLSAADAAFVDFEAGSHPRGGSCLFLAGIGRLRDDAFVVTQYLARTPDGEVMGVRHRELPIDGVQFHPESVLTPLGPNLGRNFLERR